MVFFINRVQSPQSIRLKSLVGSKLPAYCTAIGKVLLAHMDERDLDTYLRSVELIPQTPNTVTDPYKLRKHLREIRDRGYSFDNKEFETEVQSVAGPIRDHTGKVIAGISLAGPAYRMEQEGRLKKIIASVSEMADMISRRLGYIVIGSEMAELENEI